jgi:hypothetical protein
MQYLIIIHFISRHSPVPAQRTRLFFQGMVTVFPLSTPILLNVTRHQCCIRYGRILEKIPVGFFKHDLTVYLSLKDYTHRAEG